MALFSNLKEIIKLGDDLRDCKIDSVIDLPRICVIGVQSSGKSSLLESIVGFDFLPRGEGVVTRMPLELRLVRLNGSSEENLKPYAIFGEESEKITDLTLIMGMILQKQEQKSANQPKSKKIIDDPIVLTIYSPDVANLSLVDLPGITRVAIGDQDKNIEQITKDMARRYIKEERTIILCVTTANVDLTTSDSIAMALEVDPLGERTLGVITKIDLMEPGTNALKTLTNKEIELKHGYIAVKNRSKQDIDNGILVQDALKKEEEWFLKHPDYSSYPEFWGSQRLSERLSELLYKKIVNDLPKIESEISKTLTEAKGELQTLGEPLPQEEGMKFYYFSKLINTLESYVEKAISGRIPLGENTCEFQGLAEFRLMIGEFNKSKSTLFNQGLKAIKLHEMIIDILEYKRMDLPGFLPSEVLADRVKRELDSLKQPLDEFIDNVFKKDMEVLKWAFKNMKILNDEIRTFFEKEAYGYLKELVETTKKFIYNILDVEKDIIWTSDPSIFDIENKEENQHQEQQNGIYVQSNSNSGGGSNSSKQIAMVKPEPKSSLVISFSKEEIKEAFAFEKIKLPEKYQKKLEQLKKYNLKVHEVLTEGEVILFYEKLSKYFAIIDRNLSDLIPKTIGSYMMIGFHRNLKDHILRKITENNAFIKSLKDSPSVEKKRSHFKQLVSKLEKAQGAIRETKFKN